MNISFVCEYDHLLVSTFLFSFRFSAGSLLVVLHFVAHFAFLSLSDFRTSSLLVLETVIDKKYKLNMSCLLN
jgi:hypothetical protein